MNRLGLICRCIKENPYASQRELAQKTDFSLGTVNTLIKECIQGRLIAAGKSVAGTYELTWIHYTNATVSTDTGTFVLQVAMTIASRTKKLLKVHRVTL